MKLLAESIRSGGYGAEFHLLRDAGHYAPWSSRRWSDACCVDSSILWWTKAG